MALPLDPAAPDDFDFIIGNWRVSHRRLKQWITGCTDWDAFEGVSSTSKILGGFGNLEDNRIFFPGGSYRAAAIRSFDPATKRWSIWWLDGRAPGMLDTPVVGGFENGVGTFYAEEVLNGRPVSIRFLWYRSDADGNPRWEQAFSADAGVTWETNWEMTFVRE